MGDEKGRELQRAKHSAYRYLTGRPRSRAEVERKLVEKGFPEDIVADVLQHLGRLNYIDDRSFAAEWAAGRLRSRQYGRRRIDQELRRLGVARDIIDEALSRSVQPHDEREAAVKAADRKLRTLAGADRETKKRRLAGYLERRGFPAELVLDVLRTVR